MSTEGHIPPSLRWIDVVVYGAAHFGKSLLWNASSLFFAFFLTETVGLAPLEMGIVLSISLFFNAVADFIIGRRLAKVVQNASSAAHVQLIGAVAASAAFVAFASAGFIGRDLAFAYTLVTVLLFRLGYSLYDVPQNAYMAFVSSTDAERARLAATRYIAAGASILLITSLFTPFVRTALPSAQAKGFLGLAVLLAVTSVGCAVGLAFHGWKGAEPTTKSACSDQPAPTNRRDAYYWLLLSIFVLSTASPAFSKLEAYYTAYALKSETAASLFMVSVAIGKVATQPLWSIFAARTSLARCYSVAALAWAAAALLFASLGRAEPLGTILTAVLFGAASGGVFMSVWGLLALHAGTDRTRTTKRYGQFTFFSKTAQAMVILAIAVALDLFGYRSVEGGRAIVAIMSTGPALGGMVLFWVSRRPQINGD